ADAGIKAVKIPPAAHARTRTRKGSCSPSGPRSPRPNSGTPQAAAYAIELRQVVTRSQDERTIFFASDLHGSEVCFKKFVAAAKFYGADTLLLGGDISGKVVVPIVASGNGRYVASFHGQEEKIDDSTIADFEQRAWNSGLYTQRMEPDEYQHYADHP